MEVTYMCLINIWGNFVSVVTIFLVTKQTSIIFSTIQVGEVKYKKYVE